ncbi:class I SAM-dependent methyltransferase [Leptotrichia trevisanii]
MDKNKLKEEWLKEEKMAHIHGWDFSHIYGRYSEEENLPWDFRTVINKYLKNNMKLLDMETGDGEFLLSLNHPKHNTSAIEGYQPNVELCKKVLLPLGIDFKEADGDEKLPFENEYFDIITNRHGAYNVTELKRVLKKDGIFVTQQVGAENDRELVEILLPKYKDLPYAEHYLNIKQQEISEQGFEILESGETFQPIKFFDTGALVWFAKIIEWEFPNFSVESHLENLYKVQEIIEANGAVEGRIHRFYIVGKKI